MSIMSHFVSEDQADTIVGACRKGMTLKVACQLARVPYKRIKQLLAEAEELVEDPNFILHELDPASQNMIDFYFKVNEARGRAQEKWIGYIAESGEKDWKAAERMLKVHDPENWAEGTAKGAAAIAGSSSGPPVAMLDLTQLSVPELELLERLMIKLGSNGNNKQLVQTAPDRIVLVANET